MTRKIPTCKTCGQPLAPSVKELATKLQVPEHVAAQLHDYLVEKIWPEKLADVGPAKDERRCTCTLVGNSFDNPLDYETDKNCPVHGLAAAVRDVERNHPLPRCAHGSPLIDGAGERLEPPCGCRNNG